MSPNTAPGAEAKTAPGAPAAPGAEAQATMEIGRASCRERV